jgi:hypothetical protein
MSTRAGCPPGGPSAHRGRGRSWSDRTTTWTWWCAVPLAPCLVLAPLRWPLRAIVVVFVISTLIAAIGLASRHDAEVGSGVGGEPSRNTGSWASTLADAVLLGAATVGVGVLVSLSAGLALLVGLLLASCSPWTMDLVSARFARPGRVPSIPHPDVTSMSNASLCAAWRTSYDELQTASGAAQRARVVVRRQAYLDELEVRDRGGLTAWLESGARASGGPDHFLRDD